MVAALPDGTWYFKANSLNQYSTTSQLLRQINVLAANGTRRFIGLTLDGYVFLGGLDPVHISDFPLLVSAPIADAGPDQIVNADSSGFATVILDGSGRLGRWLFCGAATRPACPHWTGIRRRAASAAGLVVVWRGRSENGTQIDNPRWLRESLTDLRVAQRRLSRRVKDAWHGNGNSLSFLVFYNPAGGVFRH